jgi:Flp pilus assembly pilin Flp
MVRLAKRTWRAVRRLDRDEQGADMVEYILLVAVIALPLLAVVIHYRGKILELLSSMFSDVESNANVDPNSY